MTQDQSDVLTAFNKRNATSKFISCELNKCINSFATQSAAPRRCCRNTERTTIFVSRLLQRQKKIADKQHDVKTYGEWRYSSKYYEPWP